MITAILFLYGIAFGSFFGVVATRYDGDHFVFNPKIIGGRSRCPHCHHELGWFELIPLVSYFLQGGVCKHCKTKISLAYPVVEIGVGLIFSCVPSAIFGWYGTGGLAITLAALWVVVFCLLFLMSYIDIRLGILPDELTVMLAVVAVAILLIEANVGTFFVPFLGPYGGIFWMSKSFWLNHLIGLLFGAVFFGGIIAATRGRGMGVGDFKLAVPLGLLFGWPDMLLLTVASFVIGAAVGLVQIARHKKTMQGTLPFAPFLAVGAAAVFFFGFPLLQWYFSILGFS